MTEDWISTDIAQHPNYEAIWCKRAEHAARLIPQGSRSVLDIGCFRGHLGSLLPDNIRYTPADFIERDLPDFILLDLDHPIAKPFLFHDVICTLGVLEYLSNVPQAVRWIANHCQTYICTYAFRPHWPYGNDEPGFMDTIFNAGFECLTRIEGDPEKYRIYRWTHDMRTAL